MTSIETVVSFLATALRTKSPGLLPHGKTLLSLKERAKQPDEDSGDVFAELVVNQSDSDGDLPSQGLKCA